MLPRSLIAVLVLLQSCSTPTAPAISLPTIVSSQYHLPLGFSGGEISIFIESPDTVSTIGQIPSITGQMDNFSVFVNAMAAKGWEGVVSKLTKDLVEGGILNIPETGSTI